MPPMVGVPALVLWPWGPSSRIGWPMWRRVQHGDEHLGADERQRQGDAGGDEEADHAAHRRVRAHSSATTDAVVERGDARRRCPGWSRGPCRPPARRRRAGRRRGPGRWRRGGRARPRGRPHAGVDASNPCFTASMMAAVSSWRELSAVSTTSRPPGGDLAHGRALGGVAVATAAEHHHDPAPLARRALADEVVGGGEELVEAVGRVGVVDHHGEGLAGVDAARSGRAPPAGGRGPAAMVGVVDAERRRRRGRRPGRWRR